MTTLRRTLALSLLALSASCAFLPGGEEGTDLGAERRSLDAARERWNAARPGDYTFVVRRHCQACTLGPIAITVRGGAFVSATAEDGQPVPDWYVRGLRTVDEIFATLAETLDRRPHELETSYDPQNGVPLQAAVDPWENAIDEEWGFEVTRFGSLQPQGN